MSNSNRLKVQNVPEAQHVPSAFKYFNIIAVRKSNYPQTADKQTLSPIYKLPVKKNKQKTTGGAQRTERATDLLMQDGCKMCMLLCEQERRGKRKVTQQVPLLLLLLLLELLPLPLLQPLPHTSPRQPEK